MPTSTTENYLKHLLLLQQRSDAALPVSTGKLAAAVEVTPGTATVMVKSLADAGLIDYESRAGVRLTPRGERAALDVLRRHRIVELFLVQVLKLDWSEVHDEAEVLEHAISDKVLARLDELLGFPSVDPHGDPIPTAKGEMQARDLMSLDACRSKQRVQVARVENHDPQFLRFAEARGLTPGARLTVLDADPVADSVTLRRASGEQLVIGTAAARKIFVTLGGRGDAHA